MSEPSLHAAVIAYREEWCELLRRSQVAGGDLELEKHCRLRIQTADLFAELVASDAGGDGDE